MERAMRVGRAAGAASRRLRYGGLTTGLLICAAFITFALLSLIALSSPSLLQGPFPSNLRTLFDLRKATTHDAAPHEEDDADEGNRFEYESRIKQVFEKASMPNRTVILTTLNEAWAKEGTMINLFLESFWIGYGTQRLLQHLVFICVDEKAYERCLVIHPHCLKIKTHNVTLSQEQNLLSANYIKLVWRRMKFLKTTLEMNFNFIFTDTDVLWFRDPFPILQNDVEADIQIASDQFNSRPTDIRNKPNTGFMFVRANERTRNFFNYWYEERKRNSSLATQGIFNIIKFNETFKNIGINLHFLDPQFFGGFCGIKYTDMTKSFTMHATCCKGLEAKLIDLKIIFEGWKKWQVMHTLKTKYLKASKTKESLVNQNTTPPNIALGCNMSPKFDVPLACIKSLRKKTKK